LAGLAPRFRRRCRIRWLSRIAASSAYPVLPVPSGQGFSPVSRETIPAGQRREDLWPFGYEPGPMTARSLFHDPVTCPRGALPGARCGSGPAHPDGRPGAAHVAPQDLARAASGSRSPPPGLVQRQPGGARRILHPRGTPGSHGRVWGRTSWDVGSHGARVGKALGLPLITSANWTTQPSQIRTRAADKESRPFGFRQNELAATTRRTALVGDRPCRPSPFRYQATPDHDHGADTCSLPGGE
jgi:hypothetical protein